MTVPKAVRATVPPKLLNVALVISAKRELAAFLAKAENPTLIMAVMTLGLGRRKRRSNFTILRWLKIKKSEKVVASA